MDKKQKCIINVGGGWATDFGPSFTGAPQGNALTVPFLLSADNILYELDGAPHKVGGASVLNALQQTENGSPITFKALYDYWTQGTAGAETQVRVAYAGTQLLSETLNGVFTQRLSGLEANKEACFETIGDLCIWASTSNVDLPQRWNGSAVTFSALGGSPPNFAFMVKHKNRLFAAGVAAHPSRLYYCDALLPESWTTAGAGSIDIDPDDGDRITGLVSHRNELVIFKGPNRLSIHRLTGSSPTGSDAFARVPFVAGVGSINHNGIFRINDDVVFPSPRGIHSLAATAAFGDYVEAFLARPILSYYQQLLNHTILPQCWGVNYQARGLAIWTVPSSAGSSLDTYLVYDYRFQPGRWASWGINSPYVKATCLATMQVSGRKHKLFAGTATGTVYQLDIADRAIATTGAYTGDVKTPFLNFGTSALKKNAEKGFWSILPKGNYDFTFGYTLDMGTERTVAIAQSGGDVLG